MLEGETMERLKGSEFNRMDMTTAQRIVGELVQAFEDHPEGTLFILREYARGKRPLLSDALCSPVTKIERAIEAA